MSTNACENIGRPLGRTIGPTCVSSHVSGVHLDVVISLQPSVGIVHALDCAGKDVERGGAPVLRDWGGFQLGIPWIGESDGTVRRE